MTAALLFAFLAATIHTDFEGGSLGRIEKVNEAHFRLGALGEKDRDGRNRQASWYYFRVDGAGTQEMTFDIVDLAGEYNYNPNRGAVTKDTPPVISYDGRTWTHVSTFEYDPAEPKLRLRIKPTASRFWIAHTPPYTNEHLARLRHSIAKHPDFQEEKIGKTVNGRDLLLWTMSSRTKPAKKTVWLMFRQHSWETGSSWVGEGAVRALLSPESSSLRDSITWKILPLCDPDGVARGGVRFNTNGYDLNRNWDVTDTSKMPEISAQRGAVAGWIKGGHTADLFFSLHNTETSEYLEGPSAFQPLAEGFFAALKGSTTFAPTRPLFFSETTTTPGMTGRMTVVQGLYKDFQIPGFLMEQRISFNNRLGRLPTIDDRLNFGRELVKAIAETLR
jgi:hypothetical protein